MTTKKPILKYAPVKGVVDPARFNLNGSLKAVAGYIRSLESVLIVFSANRFSNYLQFLIGHETCTVEQIWKIIILNVISSKMFEMKLASSEW